MADSITTTQCPALPTFLERIFGEIFAKLDSLSEIGEAGADALLPGRWEGIPRHLLFTLHQPQ